MSPAHKRNVIKSRDFLFLLPFFFFVGNKINAGD